MLGGEPTPAIGWALGIERVVGLMQACGARRRRAPPRRSTWSCRASSAERAGLALGEQLRDALPGAGVLANMEGGSFKAQMKRADKSGAAYAVILGDDEVARGVAAVKSLRTAAEQQEWPWDELPRRLAALLRPGEDIRKQRWSMNTFPSASRRTSSGAGCARTGSGWSRASR